MENKKERSKWLVTRVSGERIKDRRLFLSFSQVLCCLYFFFSLRVFCPLKSPRMPHPDPKLPELYSALGKTSAFLAHACLLLKGSTRSSREEGRVAASLGLGWPPASVGIAWPGAGDAATRRQTGALPPRHAHPPCTHTAAARSSPSHCRARKGLGRALDEGGREARKERTRRLRRGRRTRKTSQTSSQISTRHLTPVLLR